MSTKKVFFVIKKYVAIFAIFGLLFTPPLLSSGHAIGAAKPADAEWLVDEGENHVWYQIAEGILTIGGVGEMPDWDSGQDTPWYGNRASTTNIIVSKGITKIGNNSFQGEDGNKYSSNLKEIVLPETLASIGEYAFKSNGNIEVIVIKNPTPPTFGEGIFWNTFEGIAFVIPAFAQTAYFNSQWNIEREGYMIWEEDWSNTSSAYFVYIKHSDGGSVSSSLEYILADEYEPEKVTLTTILEDGYFIESFTVTDENGDNVLLEGDTFVMPDKSVFVNAEFSKDFKGPKVPNTGVL